MMHENSLSSALPRATRRHSPGDLLRLVDLRTENRSHQKRAFLNALSQFGKVLWIEGCSQETEGEFKGEELFSRRLTSVGRLSRDDQGWSQTDPFAALSEEAGEGWNLLRLRVGDDADWGELLFNLGVARSFYNWIILSSDSLTHPFFNAPQLENVLKVIWIDSSSENISAFQQTNLKREQLLLVDRPHQKGGKWRGENRFFSSDESEFAEALVQWVDFRFLRRHPAHWMIRWSRYLLFPLILVALLAPIYSPHLLKAEQRMVQVVEERPSLRFEVEVKDPYEARRAARWALYKYNRRFPAEGEIRQYLKETLARSGLELLSDLQWQPMIPTTKETARRALSPQTLEFRFPESNLSAMSERERQAYHFYTSLFHDTLAYPTDYWWIGSEKQHRRHDAIDIGAVPGSTVYSPISGRAFTGEGYLGGVYIGVQDGERAILLAHCDKRLFLDGDTVHVGDALATVGMTGRTSGPHIHLMTGVADPSGTATAGGLQVKWQNPVDWYHREIAK